MLKPSSFAVWISGAWTKRRSPTTASTRIFFDSTSGGDVKNGDVNSDGFAEGYGQIWEYQPHARGGRLRLVFESSGAHELDSPDNLLVTPRGGLILCEDDAGSNDNDTHPLAPGITD